MNEELNEEQASLYVLGLLNADERRAFEERLRADPKLQALTRELADATAAVPAGLNAQAPSPELKARIFAALPEQAKPSAGMARVSVPMPATRSAPPVFAWSGWVAAACLLIAGLVGYSRFGDLSSENAALKTEAATAKLAERDAQEKIHALNDKLAELLRVDPLNTRRLVRMGPPPAAAAPVAMVLWDQEKQVGTLLLDGLPAVAANQDYQLWIIDPTQKAPVDCGVFSNSNNGVVTVHFQPKARVGAGGKFAVTLEKKGGVAAPEGAMVLIGG